MKGAKPAASITPSAQIVGEGAGTFLVKDTRGRTLEIKRPGALDRLRLFKALGPSLAGNSQYFGYAMLAMCVVAMDDVPVPQPCNEGLMEGLIGRLGDEGLIAIGQGLFDAGHTEMRLLASGGVADAGLGNEEARPG
jgi:hypothetical protein